MPQLLDGLAPATADAAVEQAAARLAAGGLVAFPTETVYGLGARADDDAAVAQIFAAKGRPADHPLIVHVADTQAADTFAATLPDSARRLMAAFWPGPVTVIVPRRTGVAAAAAGGQSSIGLRCPDHPLAQALLRRAAALGVPGVAAPSANRFGRISPTQAAHVVEEFGGRHDAGHAARGESGSSSVSGRNRPDDSPAADPDLLVLDGGPCAVGIESAIVDCTADPPALLRPGALTRDALAAALAAPVPSAASDPARSGDAAEGSRPAGSSAPAMLGAARSDSPRASGTLEAHYAPRARLRLMEAAQLRSALDLLAAELSAAPGSGPVLALYSRSFPGASGIGIGKLSSRIVHRKMPDTARAAAHELFADLRALDATGVSLIWVEAVPDTAEWEGVRDRLGRAAAAG